MSVGINKSTRILFTPTSFILKSLMIASVLALSGGQAKAAVINVTTTAETSATACTLKDAIVAANTDAASGHCPAGNGTDTINLQAKAVYSISNAASLLIDNSYVGLPSLTSNIIINGNGATITRNTGSVTPFRLFFMTNNATVALNDMTISNGYVYGGYGGGAILNGHPSTGYATLTLDRVLITNNYSYIFGGGVLNVYGTLSISNSTISGNTAQQRGGGVANYGGILDLENNTLAFNRSLTPNNTTYYGDNLFNAIGDTGSVTYGNNIFATTGPVNCYFAASSTLMDKGNNFDNDGSCNLIVAGDLPNNPLSILKLDVLKDNGGATATIALLPGSAAIGTGNCAFGPVVDERGAPRPGLNKTPAICDIGSYETGDNAVVTFDPASGSLDFGNVNVGSSVIKTVTIKNTGNSPLLLTSATVLPNPPFVFSALPDLSSVFAQNTRVFSVKYTPNAKGIQTGTVQISNNSAGGTITFNIQGTGVCQPGNKSSVCRH